MDTFNGDTTAASFVEVQTKADKIEARLIAAKAHPEAAYNKYAATIESTNKAIVGGSKAEKARES